MNPRDKQEAWVLKLCSEAMTADQIETTETIRALTGGHEAFCPQAYETEQLHRVGAIFLRIARL